MDTENMSPEEIYEMQKKNCIFCKISSNEIPSKTIIENKNFKGILDINPATKGHVLAITNEHLAVMPQMTPDIVAELGITVKNISTKLIKNLGSDGSSVFIANGAVAGQKSPHFMSHIIPRYPDDGLKLNPEIKKDSNHKEIIKKLRAAINQEGEDEILLEDEELAVICPENGFVSGHIIIAPKEKYVIFEEIPDELVKKMFQVSNKLLSVMFDNLKCQGTNLLIQNGLSAGQTNSQFSINLIPRYENDDLELSWENKSVSSEEVDKVFEELQEEMPKIKKEPVLQKSDKKEAPKTVKESYLTKSLNRLP